VQYRAFVFSTRFLHSAQITVSRNSFLLSVFDFFMIWPPLFCYAEQSTPPRAECEAEIKFIFYFFLVDIRRRVV
jgi:hypothetical protein